MQSTSAGWRRSLARLRSSNYWAIECRHIDEVVTITPNPAIGSTPRSPKRLQWCLNGLKGVSSWDCALSPVG